jgi:hypothetical protein
MIEYDIFNIEICAVFRGTSKIMCTSIVLVNSDFQLLDMPLRYNVLKACDGLHYMVPMFICTSDLSATITWTL